MQRGHSKPAAIVRRATPDLPMNWKSPITAFGVSRTFSSLSNQNRLQASQALISIGWSAP